MEPKKQRRNSSSLLRKHIPSHLISASTTLLGSSSDELDDGRSRRMSGSELFEAWTAGCNLPGDIILGILLRLPVRSLLRFRCVCKSWAALISSPSFITDHLSRASERLIVLNRRPFGVDHAASMIVRINEKRNDRVDLDLPSPCDTSGYVRLVGSCNGLLCISLCSYGSVIVLWNPATREFSNLPERQALVPKGNRVRSVFLGFGFEPKMGDYKIVRFFSYKFMGSNVPIIGLVEVYSKNADTWKELVNSGLNCRVDEDSRTALVSGAIHWLGVKKFSNSKDMKNVIVSFDLYAQVFGDMLLPESNVYGEGYVWQISVLSGLLSVLLFPTCCTLGKPVEVWVMKEYGIADSWIKQTSFRLFTGISRSLGCFMNGELILQNNKDKFFLYNPSTKKFGTLPLCSARYVYDINDYVESLASAKVGS